MAYQSPQINFVKNNQIRIQHTEPIAPISYLTASVASSGVTLTMRNNEGFSNTDPQSLVLLENLGSTQAEIVRVNGAIIAGTSLTVQALTFSHNIDTPVSRILFNQAEISGAATETGAKTVIATITLQIANQFTDYLVSGTTYAYYFVRFYNSLATTPFYSAYSDPIASSDFNPKSAGFIIRNAFADLGEDIGGRFTKEWCYDKIYQGELDVCKELKRWSWLIEQNYDLGNLSEGLDKIALPSDIEDNQTNKSILGLRISNQLNMWYLDKVEFEERMSGVNLTTLATTANVGATTLVLTDSDDFEDSGSVDIIGDNYTYTANNRTTNTLSGLTALSAGITAGVNVWQGARFGTPTNYSVNDGYIYFDISPDSDLEGRNVWIDYYKTPTKVDSDGDLISVNDPYLIQLWLEIQIKKLKGNGTVEVKDISFIDFNRRKQLLIKNEISGQKLSMRPISRSGISVRFQGRGDR